MKIETKNRKKAIAGFRQISASDQMRQQMHDIIQTGTTALNQITVDLGRQLVEAILYIEREERAGPDYPPPEGGFVQVGLPARIGLYCRAKSPGGTAAAARPQRRSQSTELPQAQRPGSFFGAASGTIAGGLVRPALWRNGDPGR